jgi:uncharacterized protein
MTRLIVIAVIVAAVVWLLRRAIAGPGRAADAPPATPEGDLVACAQCGVNLPKAEARSAEARFYCSEEHLRLGPREG